MGSHTDKDEMDVVHEAFGNIGTTKIEGIVTVDIETCGLKPGLFTADTVDGLNYSEILPQLEYEATQMSNEEASTTTNIEALRASHHILEKEVDRFLDAIAMSHVLCHEAEHQASISELQRLDTQESLQRWTIESNREIRELKDTIVLRNNELIDSKEELIQEKKQITYYAFLCALLLSVIGALLYRIFIFRGGVL